MWTTFERHVSAPWRSFSSIRKRTVLRWIFLGTLSCLIISLLINTVIFTGMDAEARFRAAIGATLIPILLCVPLFWYTSVKLRELSRANHLLEELASRDSLTGLHNRTGFARIVNDAMGSTPSGLPVGAFLMVDADHFKAINDRYGHDVGDRALCLIAATIAASLRRDDAVGRLGGEEFGVFLAKVTEPEALEIAERIRLNVASGQLETGGEAHDLSVSIGCAIARRGMSFAELCKIADARLYVAKRSGRNRVIMEEAPVLAPTLAHAQRVGTGVSPR